jgi:hypothetical protein
VQRTAKSKKTSSLPIALIAFLTVSMGEYIIEKS